MKRFMIFSFVFTFIMNLSVVNAQTQPLVPDPSFCTLEEPTRSDKVKLQDDPEYFFKPVPKNKDNPNDNRDIVSVIMGGQNYFLDMKTGKTEPIPGPYDGVPSPDGRFIVSPAQGDHITFYDREGLNEGSAPAFDDDNNPLNGVYHSIGVMDETKSEITYRAITDTITSGNGNAGSTLLYKDYHGTKDAAGKITFDENGNVPRPICSNVTDLLKTPILAKNGRMLSAYNAESGTSVIYEVKDDGNGNSICVMKKDLGFTTSKMEFSPDGSKVVFAMDSVAHSPSEIGWYEQPPTDRNMNVFVVDLESNDISRISSQTTGNAYYPSFSGDNSVVFLSQEFDKKNSTTDYYVNRVPLDEAKTQKNFDFASAHSCQVQNSEISKLMALGALWHTACVQLNEGGMTLNALALLPMALDDKQCQKMVKDNFAKNLVSEDTFARLDLGQKNVADRDKMAEFYYQEFLKFSEADLLSACPKEETKKVKVEQKVVEANGVIQKKSPMIICMQCHGPASDRPFDFTKPETLAPYKTKMTLHVLSGFMPRNAVLSETERQEVLDWIEAIPE